MELGLLALRAVIGLLFIGHGSQKLFGAFGGNGVEGTAGFFEKLGLRPGRPQAVAAGLSELGGGLLFAVGLVTPVAAALLISVMTAAVITVHAAKGLWTSEGGFEYNLVLVVVAFAVVAVGPGVWSIDGAIGLEASGAAWALAALGAGLAGGIAAVAGGRLVSRALVGSGRRRGPHGLPGSAG